ncbi:MAG: hypothetical protein FWC91_03160 [Defluviitaleaceae bacterium]|nr:hypothetical protein [Defluviitaleaceae bacterium]
MSKIGCPGPQGPAGPQGNQGLRGPKGDTGNTGLKGDQGCPGPVGPRGAMGALGLQGPQGVRGDIGPQGDPGFQGPQGVKGNPGVAGPVGPRGPAGPKGDNGPAGIQGPMGPEGSQGSQGPIGPEGSIGPEGPEGKQGPQGCPGPQGHQGIQGNIGPTGEIGPIGDTGPMGEPGATGKSAYEIAVDNGFSGIEIDWLTSLKGATGATGLQGNTGATGSNGLLNLLDGNGTNSLRQIGSTVESSSYTIGQDGIALGTQTVASGQFAPFASGIQTTASGSASSAMGDTTTASGQDSFAIGFQTVASGNSSMALGTLSQSVGFSSAAFNYNTISNGTYETAIGVLNVASALDTITNMLVIGNGNSATGLRSNAFRFEYGGIGHASSSFTSGGADYAEMFEWLDGNPLNEDRRGYFVTLNGKKIRFANPHDDYILGVVSGTPSIIGDAHGTGWSDMYLRDKFGAKIHEYVNVTHEHHYFDEDEMEEWHKAVKEAHKNGIDIPPMPLRHTREVSTREYVPILNPNYDPGLTYVTRLDRQEWAPVGMMGKLIVRDDGTGRENGFCQHNAIGIATHSPSGKGYRVLERLSEDTILILVR